MYIIIAIAAWFYPDPDVATSNEFDGGIMPIAVPIGTLASAAAQATQTVVGQFIAQQVIPAVVEL